MPTSRARCARFGVVVTTGAAAFVLAGQVAAFAGTSTPVSGDQRATAYAGNIHDGATSACAQLGFPNDTEIAVANSSGYSSGDYTITSDGQYLTVSSLPSGKQVDALIVKGGDAYNVYPASVFATLPVSGLHAPMVGDAQDTVPTISHWFLCAGPVTEQPPGPPTVPASASIEGNCTSATVTMDAGSNDATFKIDPSGTGSAHSVGVAASGEGTDTVAVDATHRTVTVSLDDDGDLTQLATFTRSAECPTGGNPGGETTVNPAVSFGTSCAHGITVSLTDAQVPDTTTESVTFTIVTPSGATQHVTVNAGAVVTKTYAVAQNTTGVVTVSANGLSTSSKSYSNKCTSVLGEKVSKKTNVLGQKVARLPFTGAPTGLMAAIAGALMLTGAVMLDSQRSRRKGRHAAR